jgi:hypothetical protein
MILLLADALPTDPISLAVYAAVMGLIIAAANALQTCFQNWRAELIAKRQRRSVVAARNAAKKSLSVNVGNAEKLTQVYEALNGNGITGELRKINQRLDGHDVRLGEIAEKVEAKKSALEKPSPPNEDR